MIEFLRKTKLGLCTAHKRIGNLRRRLFSRWKLFASAGDFCFRLFLGLRQMSWQVGTLEPAFPGQVFRLRMAFQRLEADAVIACSVAAGVGGGAAVASTCPNINGIAQTTAIRLEDFKPAARLFFLAGFVRFGRLGGWFIRSCRRLDLLGRLFSRRLFL